MNAEGRPGQEAPDDQPSSNGRRLARERVHAETRRLRIARMAEQAMPLVRYYDCRPLRDVPLSQFVAEGWWPA